MLVLISIVSPCFWFGLGRCLRRLFSALHHRLPRRVHVECSAVLFDPDFVLSLNGAFVAVSPREMPRQFGISLTMRFLAPWLRLGLIALKVLVLTYLFSRGRRQMPTRGVAFPPPPSFAQALQSGDESLLEQCLSVGDQGMIDATVERLPSSKVLQFLLRYYLPHQSPWAFVVLHGRHRCDVKLPQRRFFPLAIATFSWSKRYNTCCLGCWWNGVLL